LQLGYRLQTVSPNFIGGGRLADYSAKSELMIGRHVSVSGLLQYEQWSFPDLAPTPQSNVTGAVQLTLYPNFHLQK
jgi:hypothetical protein